MSSTHDLLTARFAIVREDLKEILNRLNDSDLAWAPTEAMRTIGGQLIEIAATERQGLVWLRDGVRVPYEEAEQFGERSESLEGLRAVLDELRAETLAYLDSLSEDDLQTAVAFPNGWWEGLGLSSVPRSEALRSLAAHEWYHTGQLVSYLWMRGDDPYSWS